MDIIRNLQKMIEQKSVFLVVVVLLLFVVCAVILFGDFNSKMGNFRDQMKKKSQKNERIKEYDKAKEELDQLKSSLPKPISTDELISQVDNFAVQNHIEIIDISAKDPQRFEEYVSVGVHMSIKVKNFKDLVLFFYMIETSPYSLKVEFLSAVREQSNANTVFCEINIVSNQIKI